MYMEMHAAVLQAPHPAAQQRSSLAVQREDAPGAADIGLDAEAACPCTQCICIKVIQPGADFARAFAIARIKAGARFGMGEVEPALAGDQEFAAYRAFGFEQVDVDTGGDGGLGGHQAGGATTDHGKAGRGGGRGRHGRT